MGLHLKITDWIDATRWRWRLEDADGAFLADHPVVLNPASPQYQGFCDLARALDYSAPVVAPALQLARLGAWVGEQVFGGLRAALRERPRETVQVHLPEAAQALLDRPLELACFDDGVRFDETGLRLVYQAEHAVAGGKSDGAELRLLAVFSLPARANPLNLRRERHELERLVKRLRQIHGAAIALRVLQYGATRETLRDALEDADGWDVVHLSGHGQRGEILLETDDGGEDPIDTQSLGRLLAPARSRLKLLLLDACYSGAASHVEARAQVGLEPMRDRGAATDAHATPLPSLGRALAGQMDCAVLAMRYPVGDGFATELMLALYEKLLDTRHPLPAALQLALQVALRKELAPSDLAPLTPVLIGARAGALRLPRPKATDAPTLRDNDLGVGFPPQPPRFIGRLQPMLRASQALAPQSARRAVLFHGMPGAGKTACALELAYRHELGRFGGHVWYRAPEAGSDIQSALLDLMHEIQRQLDAPHLGLTTALENPEHFRGYTLPRLRVLLEERALLLVLDNLETLLTDSDQWRIGLFGDVVETLLSQRGLSRVVLTSRRVPAALAGDDRVLVEPVHALSFAESVLLARELPGLRRLFAHDDDHELLRRTLRMVQGHPKLMELADGLAGDRAALLERVQAAEAQASGGDLLDAFFRAGGSHEGESRQAPEHFVRALHDWTEGVLARQASTTRQLFAFLCRLESMDRFSLLVENNWSKALARLPAPAQALGGDGASADADHGIATGLRALRDAGLIDVTRPVPGPTTQAYEHYGIHPGIAEATLACADPALLEATDLQLGSFFVKGLEGSLRAETDGNGELVTVAARRGLPYLMRTRQWGSAGRLLEILLHRDERPDTVAFALPVMRVIAAQSAGSSHELQSLGVLSRNLHRAGRREEAEQTMRRLLALAHARQDFKIASSVGGNLMGLLWESGDADRALQAIDAAIVDVRKSGYGPWTELAMEGQRLQLLAAMGEFDIVREEIERLRARMAELPRTPTGREESVTPWGVHETMLDTGRKVATSTQRWEEELALSDDILASQEARGAGAIELAQTRFNKYGSLLRLQRFDELRALVVDCRQVFERERYVRGLTQVYSATAHLEAAAGAFGLAADFERMALDYSYQRDDPTGCLSSHLNLASFLRRAGSSASQVLAHRLAGTLLALQVRSAHLKRAVDVLASGSLDGEDPPAFDAVVRGVETEPGVRFAALFDRLPRTFGEGDEALRTIWRMAREEKRRATQARTAADATFDGLPPAVRAAFDVESEDFSDALHEALSTLSKEESDRVLQILEDGGFVRSKD